MTDVELDSRVTALEENPGGGGDSVNGKTICVIHIQIMKNLEKVANEIEHNNLFLSQTISKGLP